MQTRGKCTVQTLLESAPRMQSKSVIHDSLLLAEINPRIWKCVPGWTGSWCDEKCPNLGRGQFYTAASSQEKGNCAVATCNNKLQPGQYYSGSAEPGESTCPVGNCDNAKKGQYYLGSPAAGGDTCPVASCTTKLKPGQYFTTDGGTSPSGCKIGQGLANSTAGLELTRP